MNKRKRERIDFACDVILETKDGKSCYANSRDISMNGIFLKTDNSLPVATEGKIYITMQLGDEKKKVAAQFKVVRTVKDSLYDDEIGMCLEIFGLDTESSINLYNMIRYNKK
ncbi:PilZ domain-containing protein [Spirochaetota bacterium]